MKYIHKSHKIDRYVHEFAKHGRLDLEKEFIQHGKTSVYDHSLHVAYTAEKLNRIFHLHCDEDALVRGALLHDYFLYDWHEKSDTHRLHGFFHPGKSYANASVDFTLNEIEKDIIVKHMFPLTVKPPKYRESWLVCMADKYCAGKEMLLDFLSI